MSVLYTTGHTSAVAKFGRAPTLPTNILLAVLIQKKLICVTFVVLIVRKVATVTLRTCRSIVGGRPVGTARVDRLSAHPAVQLQKLSRKSTLFSIDVWGRLPFKTVYLILWVAILVLMTTWWLQSVVSLRVVLSLSWSAVPSTFIDDFRPVGPIK